MRFCLEIRNENVNISFLKIQQVEESTIFGKNKCQYCICIYVQFFGTLPKNILQIIFSVGIQHG